MGKLSQNEKISMVLAGVLILSIFAPWVDSTHAITGDLYGYQFIGFLGVFAVVHFVILISAKETGYKRWSMVIAGALCLGVVLSAFPTMESEIARMNRDLVYGHAGHGIGLYLALSASIGLVLLGLLSKEPKKDEALPKPYPLISE